MVDVQRTGRPPVPDRTVWGSATVERPQFSWPEKVPGIEAPVLVIWGERDRYIGRELAEPSRTWVPNALVERLPDTTHWVQNDQPERVNQLLSEFLSSPAGRRSPG